MPTNKTTAAGEITLTRQQYRVTVQAVCVASWIADGNPNGTKLLPAWSSLMDHLLQYRAEFDCGDLLDAEKGGEEAAAELPMIKSLIELLDEYNDAVFWDQLSLRLADRDLQENHSIERIVAMGAVEYEKKRRTLRDNYDREFRRTGLRYLRLGSLMGRG